MEPARTSGLLQVSQTVSHVLLLLADESHHPLAVNFYHILFDAVRKDPDSVGHGKDGYYFVENLEYSACEVAEAISQALFELKVADTAEPNAFSDEELMQTFGVGHYYFMHLTPD